jgi:hypothetical protein
MHIFVNTPHYNLSWLHEFKFNGASVFLQFFEVPARTHTVPLRMPRRARHADGWG